jgi:hypothetical protein
MLKKIKNFLFDDAIEIIFEFVGYNRISNNMSLVCLQWSVIYNRLTKNMGRLTYIFDAHYMSYKYREKMYSSTLNSYDNAKKLKIYGKIENIEYGYTTDVKWVRNMKILTTNKFADVEHLILNKTHININMFDNLKVLCLQDSEFWLDKNNSLNIETLEIDQSSLNSRCIDSIIEKISLNTIIMSYYDDDEYDMGAKISFMSFCKYMKFIITLIHMDNIQSIRLDSRYAIAFSTYLLLDSNSYEYNDRESIHTLKLQIYEIKLSSKVKYFNTSHINDKLLQNELEIERLYQENNKLQHLFNKF